MENDVKLTKLSKCAGCGAKVGAGTLQKLLADLKVNKDENLLVGFDKSDDACVYKINDDVAIVQTVDFFPPISDDPYTFGQIAAANALSDIYAMGAIPKTALNIMAVPKDMESEVVREILRGGYDKVYEAGAVIAGGHSIYDDEPKYGLSVTGFVSPDKIIKNSGAKPDDILIYTKPLGIGIITTAIKADVVSNELTNYVYDIMKTLNKYACECMLKYDIHACTDVTGFSLLGHSLEMAQGSNVKININTKELNIIDKALDYAKMGFIPEGAYRNREFAQDKVLFDNIPLEVQDVLYSPETSGGLLIALSKGDGERLLFDLNKQGVFGRKIAECEEYIDGKLIVINQV